MSEYQYYEFLAVDRPLNTSEMDALRAISTRATITPRSFANEYSWSDLEADPTDLLVDYFDVHVYVSNRGTRVLGLRLPRELLSPEHAAERVRYLRDLAERQEDTWARVEELIEDKTAASYGQAVALLVDLHEVATNADAVGTFARRLHELRDRHRHKRRLHRQLDRAGLRTRAGRLVAQEPPRRVSALAF